MKIDGLNHPKTKELAYTLEIPLPHAIGLLELLWAFVAQQTPQGNVGKWSNAVIAGEAGWDREPDEFVNALISVRFLDEHPDHRLLVHDWSDHAPNWVHAKLKKKGKSILSADLSSDLRTDLSKGQDPPPEATTSLAKPKSIPVGTGKPVSEKSADPKTELWNRGVALLTKQGHAEKSARSFLGKLAKDLGEADALEAVKAAEGKADALTFLGACKRVKLPTDRNEIWRWRHALGLDYQYDENDIPRCHAEMREAMRKKPDVAESLQ